MQVKMDKEKVVSKLFRITEESAQKIEEISKKEGVTRSYVLRKILEAYFSETKKS